MEITRLILTACLLGFCINLPAQEADEPKRVFKAPNGKPFPIHWGQPPLRQTRDLRALPAGYGRGSGTLARWIQEKLDNDAKKWVQSQSLLHQSGRLQFLTRTPRRWSRQKQIRPRCRLQSSYGKVSKQSVRVIIVTR